MDTSGEFTYIFKLSDDEYLQYDTLYTDVDGEIKPKITLTLENII